MKYLIKFKFSKKLNIEYLIPNFEERKLSLNSNDDNDDTSFDSLH